MGHIISSIYACVRLGIVFGWQLIPFRNSTFSQIKDDIWLLRYICCDCIARQRRQHIAHLSSHLLCLAHPDSVGPQESVLGASRVSSWSGSSQVIRESSKPQRIIFKSVLFLVSISWFFFSLFFPALASFFLIVNGMLYFLSGYKNLSIGVHYDIKKIMEHGFNKRAKKREKF